MAGFAFAFGYRTLPVVNGRLALLSQTEPGCLPDPEAGALFPFDLRLARMIGRGQRNAAIDYLRTGRKGDKSDVDILEMMAMLHRGAGRNDEAISVSREALALDPASFDSHALLAEILAENGEHEQAALHARRGLEHFPEPMPEMPKAVWLVWKALFLLLPRLRRAYPDGRLPDFSHANTAWFDWARAYLDWYDSTFAESTSPTEH